jgi:hypothetical protein
MKENDCDDQIREDIDHYSRIAADELGLFLRVDAVVASCGASARADGTVFAA